MKARFAKFVLLSFVFLADGLLALRVPRRVFAEKSTGRITVTGKMTSARFCHTATLLQNGKVFISGGMSRQGVFQPVTEIYDPTIARFIAAATLPSPRIWGATATLLPDGKVLLAGGSNGSTCNQTADLYDPSTNTFTRTGNMTASRCSAAAIPLRTGEVLMVGGDGSPDSKTLPSAELYHPSTGTFTATGSMHTPRDYFAAVLVKDGRILVLGGSSNGQRVGRTVEEKSAEIYDPATGRFSPAGDMNSSRNKVGAAFLDDRVLVVGGQTGGPFGARLATTEIFNPVSNKFSLGPKMTFERFKLLNGVVSLRDGRILVAGGADQPELYDPASNSFLPIAGVRLDSFYFSTATLLQNGQVLIAGGYGHNPGAGGLNHAWLYQP